MAIFVRGANVRVHYNLQWDYLQGLPGGATYEAARDSARAAFHYVRSEIQSGHSRSGALAASMRTDVSKRGSRQVLGLVRSDVEHAAYFFYGTAGHGTGRIYPNTAKMLHLQDPAGYSPIGKARLMPSVQGQDSNFDMLEQGAAIGATRIRMGKPIPTNVRY